MAEEGREGMCITQKMCLININTEEIEGGRRLGEREAAKRENREKELQKRKVEYPSLKIWEVILGHPL